MSDHLAPLPPAQVAAWYGRLADRIALERIPGVGSSSHEPLAAIFLRHWLANRDPQSTFHFDPPSYLQRNAWVDAVLDYHKDVFLSQRRARVPGGERLVGVLPRIRGEPGFTRWDLSGPLVMHYQSLVEVGSGLVEIARIQRSGTPAERDLLTSLRGFQLRSQVVVTGNRRSGSAVEICFTTWTCIVIDRYDWDYREHFTVPNPDYGSPASDAVRPRDRTLRVYHRNAERVERAGLAAPFNVESRPWLATDRRWLGARATVTP
jgi:hypothetical protein